MKEADAYELAKHIINVEANKDIFVTEDNCIYINSPIDQKKQKGIFVKINGVIQPLKKSK